MLLRNAVYPLACATLLTISMGSRAKASFIVNIVQSGSDVVAMGSGTLNTAGLTGGNIDSCTTLAGVGLTDGSYVYTWGERRHS